MDLILIRHGECNTHSIDDTLTDVGKRQAQQIGQRLAKMSITALLKGTIDGLSSGHSSRSSEYQ